MTSVQYGSVCFKSFLMRFYLENELNTLITSYGAYCFELFYKQPLCYNSKNLLIITLYLSCIDTQVSKRKVLSDSKLDNPL